MLACVLCSTFGIVNQDSTVGIATCYGLDGPEIKCQWRQKFPNPSRPTLRPSLLCNGYQVSFTR